MMGSLEALFVSTSYVFTMTSGMLVSSIFDSTVVSFLGESGKVRSYFPKTASSVSSLSQSASKVYVVVVGLIEGSSFFRYQSFLSRFNTPTTFCFMFCCASSSVTSLIITPEDFDFVFNLFEFLTTISGILLYQPLEQPL